MVETLASELENRGVSCWLDKWNLVPGDSWQPALEIALTQCETCVVFFGPHGLGPWHNQEMRLAMLRRVNSTERKLRVLPVILPGGQRAKESDLPGFLQGTMWVEFDRSLDDEDAMHRLVCGIRGISPGRRAGVAVAIGECPYLGLRTFQPDDAPLFFGREAKIQELVNRLRKNLGTPGGQRFLILFGASGSGKSSLALAGLIPAIARGELPDSDAWTVVRMRPGADPWEALQMALASNDQITRYLTAVPALITRPEDAQRQLHLTAGIAFHQRPESHRLFIVIDQFEETFTLCKDEAARAKFIDNILWAASAADGRTIVVLTMRADFFEQCAAYPGLRAAVSEYQSLIGPLSVAELREAIELPAQFAGGELEPGLTELLLADVEQRPGALPFLEHALEKLWERRDGRRLVAKAYTEMGRLEGALEAHAEEFFTKALALEEQPLCRQMMVDLVRPGEGSADTKKRLTIGELAPTTAKREVLKKLVDTRLVTTDENSEVTGGQAELAHEALIAGWMRLGAWLNEDRERLRLKERLLLASAEWEKHDREDSYLYRGTQLDLVEETFSAKLDDLSRLSHDFVSTSLLNRDREIQDRDAQRFREIERERQLREEQTARAKEAEDLNRSFQRQLGSLSWISAEQARDQDRDPILAVNLFLRAAESFEKTQEPGLCRNAVLAARTALASSSLKATFPHDDRVYGAVFSKDESRLLTWSGDSKARLWMVGAGGPELLQAFTNERGVRDAIFAKDERLVLTRDGDNKVKLWSVGDGGQEPRQTLAHEKWVQGAIFAPDERQILTWSEDGEVRLWEVNGDCANPLRTFTHDKSVSGAKFAKDGSKLLTWSGDGTARLWSLEGGETPLQIFAHTGPVHSAALSSDESMVATLSTDGTLCLWAGPASSSSLWERWRRDGLATLWAKEEQRPKPLQTLTHKGASRGTFSKDASRVLVWDYNSVTLLAMDAGSRYRVQQTYRFQSCEGAIFSTDKSWILMWNGRGEIRGEFMDTSESKPFRSLEAVRDIRGVLLSKDQNRLVAWSKDGVAQLWSLEQFSAGLLQTFIHQDAIRGAAFTQDERDLLTWSDDGTARIWAVDVPLKRPIRTFEHNRKECSPIVSEDESRLLTLGKDDVARLWAMDAVDNGPLQTFSHGGDAHGACFSRDGSLLLTWGDDGLARLWVVGVGGKESAQNFRHDGALRGGLFTRDGRQVLTWSVDGTARLWDVNRRSQEPLRIFTHQKEVLGAVFSRDESRLLTWSEDGTVNLWAIGSNSDQPLDRFKHDRPARGAVFSKDESRVLTWDGFSDVWLWALGVADKESLQSFWNFGIKGTVFSNDESRVLTWGRDEAKLWAVGGRDEDQEPLQTFRHTEFINGAAFTKDDRRVLTWGHDGAAKLWSVVTSRRELLQVFKHEWTIEGVAFSKDESLLLTWGIDSTANLWAVGAGGQAPLWTFAHEGSICGALFNRDETKVLTWDDDAARLWRMPSEGTTPVTQQVLELEVLTATQLHGSKELRVLNFDDWQAKKREL